MTRALRTSSPRRRAERGQALILTVLLMLFVTVTVFLTFAIGARTRRKIQLQSVADSTAYSLAVAEARAFNFYAWSNRALVAHNVSILSVHAHTSYLTFYEDMLAATANNYRLLARRNSGATAAVLEDIADLYLNSDVTIDGKFCHWIPDPNSPTGKKCSVDVVCGGSANCDLDIDNHIRGAEFFHHQWHAKKNSNSCLQLVEASRDHFRKVELLRAHQLGVEAQLMLMMTGDYDDMLPSDDSRLDASTRKSMYSDLRGNIVDLHRQASLPQHLAMLSDSKLTAEKTAGLVSRDYYKKAVADGLEGNYHKDWDEILAGTRFPNFIAQRGFQEDTNWKRLDKAAKKKAATVGATTLTQVTSHGTSRMLKLDSIADDPGQSNDTPGPLVDVWPPVYRRMPPLKAGDPPRPAYQLPPSGVKLAADIHRENDAEDRWGDGDGIASEDHGWVDSWFNNMRERTVIDAGRNTVWGDPHDYDGLNTHDPQPGDDITHSDHIFHGDLMRVPGHGSGLGKCDNALCNSEQRGVYRGHMRFRLSDNENNLWNMPRTMTLITTPVPDRMPWDFNFRMQFPHQGANQWLSFSTTQSVGDEATDRTMAAFGGGLVYFHKPPNSGEEYGEPPNLWNPFWRAKLHPVRQRDARDASTPHAATRSALLELDGYKVVNY
jgi:hypothetical protein